MRISAQRPLRQFRLIYSDEQGHSKETPLPYWMGWRFARWRAQQLSRRFGEVTLVYVSNLLRWRVERFSPT